MNPNEVLDLNVGQVQAFVDGSEEARFYQRTLLVEQAYWTRVYKGKKPKSPSDYIEVMRKEFDKAITGETSQHKQEVDVAAFQRLEQQRLQFMQNRE